MIGRLLVCAIVAVAASVVWRSGSGGATNGRAACGVERWAVKTLQDRPVLRPARPTTIRFLVTRRPPAHLPTRRLPFERNVFTVVAAVTGIRAEDDGDLHLLFALGWRRDDRGGAAGGLHVQGTSCLSACGGPCPGPPSRFGGPRG